jgi:hypothetical protein
MIFNLSNRLPPSVFVSPPVPESPLCMQCFSTHVNLPYRDFKGATWVMGNFFLPRSETRG